MAEGRLVGEFMVYYDTPRPFDGEAIELALTLARQLGFAIERMRAEQARLSIEAELRLLSEKLEEEVERRTLERDRIWNVSEDLLAVSNFEGYFLSINPAWTKLLGWTEDEIKSMHVESCGISKTLLTQWRLVRSWRRAFKACEWRTVCATRTDPGAGYNGRC